MYKRANLGTGSETAIAECTIKEVCLIHFQNKSLPMSLNETEKAKMWLSL